VHGRTEERERNRGEADPSDGQEDAGAESAQANHFLGIGDAGRACRSGH
jgi:hypothetical protein